MKTKSTLENSDIKLIAAAAEAEAVKNNWAVSIAIVDEGGHLLHFNRLDGAPAMSSHIAPSKAHTAALARKESKVRRHQQPWPHIILKRPHFARHARRRCAHHERRFLLGRSGREWCEIN